MAEILQKLYKEYQEAVSQNSAFVAQCESIFRLVSYAISGRFEDSTILSELLYSASNLLVLFNDAIIKKAYGILPTVSASKERLQRLVTVLEYVGVFVELAVARRFGERGRWVAITALQIAKCVCRFLLFGDHQSGIQPVPPIFPIDRESFIKLAKNKTNADPLQAARNNADSPIDETGRDVETDTNQNNLRSPPKSFMLQRSGKLMRSLADAVPVGSRDWRPPTPDTPEQASSSPDPKGKTNTEPTQLSPTQRLGEYLYIVKPLVHLAGLFACGQASFKPWALSSSMDVASLYLARKGPTLNQQELSELRRRTMMLLLYSLRSPMYDRFTKERLLTLLRRLSSTIPGISLLITPVMEYLPVWQQIYFYTWST